MRRGGRSSLARSVVRSRWDQSEEGCVRSRGEVPASRAFIETEVSCGEYSRYTVAYVLGEFLAASEFHWEIPDSLFAPGDISSVDNIDLLEVYRICMQ